MAIEAIIGLVIVVVIGLILFKVTKSILKAIFIAASVGVLIVIILGAFVVVDAMRFQESFSTQSSLYLLVDNGKIIAGFSGVLAGVSDLDLISAEELSVYQSNYDQNDLDVLKSDNYKIFILKRSVFESLETIPGDLELTREEAFAFLDSDSPIDDFIEKQLGDVSEIQKKVVREGLLEDLNVEDDTEFKGVLFASMFGAVLEEEGPLLIFDEYKNGRIIVYPETALFKFMKRMPTSLLGNIIKTAE